MTSGINYSELVPVPDELHPVLKPVEAKKLPTTANTRPFVESTKLCLEINGRVRHHVDTGLRSSASLFVVKPNAEGVWTVLMKKEAKAFLSTEVLTPPGGYRDRQDDSLATLALRKGYEEAGLPTSPNEVMDNVHPLEFWLPEGAAAPLIDLDYDTPPAPYPNNSGAVQASFLLVVKSPEILIRRNKRIKDNWCMAPVFPVCRTAEHKAEWAKWFNPHGVAGNGLKLVQEYLEDAGLSTRTGLVTETWLKMAA